MIDVSALPPRLHLPQVLELAGYGRSTLRLRQRAGKMPREIDRGPRGGIYSRDAVLTALGISDHAQQEAIDPWNIDDDALREAFSGSVRRSEKAGGR